MEILQIVFTVFGWVGVLFTGLNWYFALKTRQTDFIIAIAGSVLVAWAGFHIADEIKYQQLKPSIECQEVQNAE